jgi:citrate lyase beta subunit
VRSRILALRIGGNDLLALLGLRRPVTGTIYQGALGQVIGRLVTTFRPHGFALSAPVFEHITQRDWLDAEVAQDLAHGLLAKTAIHPDQVAQIERHYQVPQQDLELALRIIDPDCAAVFRMRESMCEVATHGAWARQVIEQARQFGIRHPDDNIAKCVAKNVAESVAKSVAKNVASDVVNDVASDVAKNVANDIDKNRGGDAPTKPPGAPQQQTDQGETRS